MSTPKILARHPTAASMPIPARGAVAFASAILTSAALLSAALLWAGDGAAVAQSSGALTGTFRIDPGTCTGAGATFRMILPTGTAAQGPFVSNEDSTCADKTVTTLAPGTDGGLVTGAYQPEPSPAFDSNGNSRATRLTQPVTFFGVRFSTSTNPTDPQAGAPASRPTITVDSAGNLSGNLDAFAASWNNQEFNQGAPKPGGSRPGLTSGPSGTYNAASGAFTLEWTTEIVGGPFNNFTGAWHLQGRFTPTNVPPPSTTPTTATSAPVPGSPAVSPATTAPKPVPSAGQSPATTVTTTSTPPTTVLDNRSVEAATPALIRTSTPVPLWAGLSVLLLGLVVAVGTVVASVVDARAR